MQNEKLFFSILVITHIIEKNILIIKKKNSNTESSIEGKGSPFLSLLWTTFLSHPQTNPLPVGGTSRSLIWVSADIFLGVYLHLCI